jgi:hypothetical protein
MWSSSLSRGPMRIASIYEAAMANGSAMKRATIQRPVGPAPARAVFQTIRSVFLCGSLTSSSFVSPRTLLPIASLHCFCFASTD